MIRSGYTPLAFGGRRLWAASADAALLFAVMVRYAFLARRVDQTAAVLAVPEVAWTAFATVLSTAVAAKTANWPECCRAGRGARIVRRHACWHKSPLYLMQNG